MTVSTTTGGAPLVVGLGGTLRANSSTERALRYCLDAVERQGGRTKFFAGPDLDLPMYAPHDLGRRRPARGRRCAESARSACHPATDVRSRRLGNRVTEVARKTILVDGMVTGYLEAGQGDPVVLLHGGEFGVSAEIGWERNIAA